MASSNGCTLDDCRRFRRGIVALQALHLQKGEKNEMRPLGTAASRRRVRLFRASLIYNTQEPAIGRLHMSLGWIRKGDKAACGGVVADGLPTVKSHGVEASFQGARMTCPKNCTIAEGLQQFTLPNGRKRSHHGHRTTGGCPLISTCNGVDGWGGGSTLVPASFFQNADGQWVDVAAPTSAQPVLDEMPHLADDSIEGVPYFVETVDGRTFAGRTQPSGLLPRIESPHAYKVYWGDQALARLEGASQ